MPQRPSALSVGAITPITVLADYRRERESLPARQLADTLVRAYRKRAKQPPETLLDARRSCHSLRHRPLCPKLQREIDAALRAGVTAYEINLALRAFADAVAPIDIGRAA
ncbi:MAG: hypothetical protein H7099_17490 [Gemmatimonadaceae bacterium]|nr:hypothetical protein [Gemmatimonadaceae bacterium]